MVIHIGDWVEFVSSGNLYQAEVIGRDPGSSYMDIAVDVSNFTGIHGTTELTKSQYVIYTNTNEYEFLKSSVGKIILWITSSSVKKIKDGTGKISIETYNWKPIQKPLKQHEIDEIENKKRLIKFFFKDLEEPYIAPPNSPFKYI